MVHNVEQILSRGERIELLVDKTDNMATNAHAFRRGARTVRRQQFWKNQKIMIIGIGAGIVCLRIPSFYYVMTDSACSSSCTYSSPRFAGLPCNVLARVVSHPLCSYPIFNELLLSLHLRAFVVVLTSFFYLMG